LNINKKIIILGGLGYIGTELAKIYSGESWYNEVVVLDKRFISERVNQLKVWNIKYLNEDILNLQLLKKILKNFDVIHHLAGITDVAYLKTELNSNQEKEILKVAIDGTRNVLESMAEKSKIIFPSTHVIFNGLKKVTLNINESHIPRPILAYAKGKFQNEKDIIKSKKKYIILRLGSVYGYSTDTTRIGIMPNFFSKITSLGGTIKIDQGGKQHKSLVNIIDVARCFKFFEFGENIKNEIFNLNKDNTTVKKVALLCKKFNPKVKIISLNNPIPNNGYTLSNKKLLKTGFKFLYNLENSLKDMIERWKFEKNNKSLEYSYGGSKIFKDDRGLISNYELTEPINLIGYIHSKKHSIRANHFHPIQEQKCLLVSGQYISLNKNLFENDSLLSTSVVNEGSMVVTRPNVAHTMIFTKDSVLLNLVKGEREHGNYGITHTIPYKLIEQNDGINLAKIYKFQCRCCGSHLLERVISLGFQPLANNLVNNLNEKIKKYPLELNYCLDCYNFQLSCVVNPSTLFKKYYYLSSTSSTFVRHFYESSQKYIKNFSLNKKFSYILDVGSNDGIGLKSFKDLGFKNLYGIEPASNLAKITNSQGIKTYNSFLTTKLAKKIKTKFNLIMASNVFAHVDDLKNLTEAMKILLEKNGILIIEVQYILDTLKDLSFDNIYHEHVNYWSLTSLNYFFNKFGLVIFDCEKINTHGGSIRVYIKKKTDKVRIKTAVFNILREELIFGINNIDKIKVFEKKISTLSDNFNLNFRKIKDKYKNIVFYGAPAKATTRLNYFRFFKKDQYEAIEDNLLKVGKYVPGINIKIISGKKIKNKFDCVIVLAWNFFDDIKKNFSSIGSAFYSIRDLESNKFKIK
jgi:nucleoside-diphosphate-sugar epimerase/SAM-dependent methyltransferase